MNLSKILRRLYNFILIPIAFRNGLHVMHHVFSIFSPFIQSIESTDVVLRRGGIRLKIRTLNSLDIGSVLEVYIKHIYTPEFIYIPENPVIVDIGDSIGDFSVFCGSTFKGARVLSFEPTSEAFAILQENITTNNLKDCVTPFCLGVSGSSSEFSYAGESYKSISLESILKDNALKKIDLMKMDIEGMEYAVFFNTSTETLSCINAIAMECHITGNSDEVDKLVKYLTDASFKVRRTSITAHNICFLYAWRI